MPSTVLSAKMAAKVAISPCKIIRIECFICLTDCKANAIDFWGNKCKSDEILLKVQDILKLSRDIECNSFVHNRKLKLCRKCHCQIITIHQFIPVLENAYLHVTPDFRRKRCAKDSCPNSPLIDALDLLISSTAGVHASSDLGGMESEDPISDHGETYRR